MSTPAPTVFKRTEPPAVAIAGERLSLQVDTDGLLYLSSAPGDIQFREETGALFPSDDTTLNAARLGAKGDFAQVY